MKSNIKELEIAKKRIELLAGREVKLRVNEGRNKIKNYVGVVDGMYKENSIRIPIPTLLRKTLSSIKIE